MRPRTSTPAALATCLALITACSTNPSWPDPPFSSPTPDESTESAPLSTQELDAVQALAALRQAPRDEERIIWYGRRLAYLGHYEQAIDVYTRGLELHPRSPRLLRHRGHRWISLRRFEQAMLDFERAAERIEGQPDEVEPDGLPNARGIPTSTLHTNIWYHLGLARYCRGEYERALASYERCLAACRNPDMESATRYWLFLTAERLSDADAMQRALAGVRADWDIIENEGYHRLLLLFRGDMRRDEVLATLAPDEGNEVADLTLRYGLARDDLAVGDAVRGLEELRALASLGSPAFGCIAAEADLARP